MGVVTTDVPTDVTWCCLVTVPEVHYRKPDNMTLYHKMEAQVRCEDGWTEPACDQISDGLGCCNSDECSGCIRNGHWQGTLCCGDSFIILEFYLSFGLRRC